MSPMVLSGRNRFRIWLAGCGTSRTNAVSAAGGHSDRVEQEARGSVVAVVGLVHAGAVVAGDDGPRGDVTVRVVRAGGERRDVECDGAGGLSAVGRSQPGPVLDAERLRTDSDVHQVFLSC